MQPFISHPTKDLKVEACFEKKIGQKENRRTKH